MQWFQMELVTFPNIVQSKYNFLVNIQVPVFGNIFSSMENLYEMY